MSVRGPSRHFAAMQQHVGYWGIADSGVASGLVSKRRDSRYRGGPSRDWIKIKNLKSPAMNRAKDMF
jgi:hypothetical protein